MSETLDISATKNAKAFHEMLTLTKAGDRIIYHRGQFAAGAHKSAAMDAASAGLVLLFQKKVISAGGATFEYIAQRTEKKWKTS
jgi:hypothetical protein